MKSIQFQIKDMDFPTQVVLAFVNREMPKLNDGLWECRFQKPKRTDQENKIFWVWINCISEETGQDKQSLYQYFCQMFIPESCTYRQNGTFASGGTSELNTKQFATFLTEIKAHVAAELGINLPNKEDESFMEFYNQYCK